MGGSIGCAGSGSVTSGAHSVCETNASGRPAIEMMSPANPLLDRCALQAAESEDLRHAPLLDQIAVGIEHLDGLIRFHAAGKDAAGDDAAEIGIGLEDCAQHAERAFLDRRRGDVTDHEVEQRRHPLVLGACWIGRHPALLGGAVKDGEIELLFGRIERGEQIEDLVGDFARAGVGAVDLVDEHDGLETHFQRLGDDEFRLRQRSLGGIDQHQSAIDHVEDALDLAAEIGMAGRVDDIDARVLPDERGRLGEDGDATLPLEIVGIHGALGDALVLAERAGLLQQAVDQRGLAVVDVGDNGDVAQVHAGCVKFGLC